MKYGILILLFCLLIIGILNNIEIRKIKKLNKEKQATLKLIDHYMKLYWEFLPNFTKELKKSKFCDKKIVEQLILERNHIYESMDITTKLIKHAKIQELIEKLSQKLEQEKNSNLNQKKLKLQGIEAQIINISKEYERINQEMIEKKKNPFLKFILPFIKI